MSQQTVYTLLLNILALYAQMDSSFWSYNDIFFTWSKFGWGLGILVYPIILFSLPLSDRSPDMTGTLCLNSNNQNLLVW